MLLTAVHLGCTGVMSQGMKLAGAYDATSITFQQVKSLVLFSLIFTINIWVSNFSLMAVSVAVHQVFRTTIPLFTMGLSYLLYQESYPMRMLPAIGCVILGVVFTITGDIEITLYGALVVASGCLFSSLKGLMSQKAQIGSAGLQTFDLLRVVCPMSVFQLLFLALLTGELHSAVREVTWSNTLLYNLAVQGALAAALNFVSFKCAALKNPLTMNIAGNIKQVVTPLIALTIFGGHLTLALVTGLTTTSIGAFWYSHEARMAKEIALRDSAETVETAETATSSPVVGRAGVIELEPLGTGDGKMEVGDMSTGIGAQANRLSLFSDDEDDTP